MLRQPPTPVADCRGSIQLSVGQEEEGTVRHRLLACYSIFKHNTDMYAH